MSTINFSNLTKIKVSKNNQVTELDLVRVGNTVVWRKQYTVSFSAQTYGTWEKSSITVPYGTTYSKSSNSIIFTLDGVEINRNTLTMPENTDATASEKTGYTYSYQINSSSGTITQNTSIDTIGSRADRNYYVYFSYRNSGSISPTSAIVPAGATISINNNGQLIIGETTVTPTPGSSYTSKSTVNQDDRTRRTYTYTMVYGVGSWDVESGTTINQPRTFYHTFTTNVTNESYGPWQYLIKLIHPGQFTVSNTYSGKTASMTTLGGFKLTTTNSSSGTKLIDRLTSGTASAWVTHGTKLYLWAYTSNDYTGKWKPSVGCHRSDGTIYHLSGPVETESLTLWRGGTAVTINAPYDFTLRGGTSGALLSTPVSCSNSSSTKGTTLSGSWTLKNTVGKLEISASWGSMSNNWILYNDNSGGSYSGKPGGWYGTIKPNAPTTTGISVQFSHSSGTQIASYTASFTAKYYQYCP